MNQRILFLLAFFLNAIIASAQSTNYHPVNTDSTKLKKIHTIGIVKPDVYKDIPATKMMIINALKDKLSPGYNCIVINDDSIRNAIITKDLNFLNNFLNENEGIDAFILSKHSFVPVSYENSNKDTFESQIELLLYDTNGYQITRSFKNSVNNLRLFNTHNGMKILERTTKAGATPILEKLNVLNGITPSY